MNSFLFNTGKCVKIVVHEKQGHSEEASGGKMSENSFTAAVSGNHFNNKVSSVVLVIKTYLMPHAIIVK